MVLDRSGEENNAFTQQAGVDVEPALATRGVLYHLRNKILAVDLDRIAHSVAFPATGLYGISKLALVGLTTSLAKQLGKDGITCNAIAPGNVMSDAGKMLVPDDSPFIRFLDMTCALRARGEPDELVGTALLLCSEAGRWITGQTIHVDGGWVLRP